jgi:hypothetical protein
MRIAFDMDGVLADMDGGLTRLAEEMFGRDMLGRKSRSGARGASGQGQRGAISGSSANATSTGAPEGETAAEQGAPPPESVDESLSVLARLSQRQETQLWKRVAETSDFWMSLDETEAGIVAHLGRLAKDLRWEVIFVTQRPPTSGQTVQRQTQRWLRKHGFEMPSVYTTRGSRGKIAAALTLDALVDDRLQNCVDVATESRAWSIYIARGVADAASIEVRARRMGIAVVSTLMEALDKIEAAERTVPAKPEETGLLARLRKSFGAGGR